MIDRRLFLSSAAGMGGMLSLGNVSFSDEINKDETENTYHFELPRNWKCVGL